MGRFRSLQSSLASNFELYPFSFAALPSQHFLYECGLTSTAPSGKSGRNRREYGAGNSEYPSSVITKAGRSGPATKPGISYREPSELAGPGVLL